MSESTNIEWCDSTFNPWVGCTKISPACDHCYAESWAKRSGQVEWGNHPRRRTMPANWAQPLRWQRQAEHHLATSALSGVDPGRRRRVFCASLADVFDNQVPVEWRHDLWSLIERCWAMDWLLLTKRPQNIEKMLPDTPTWENIRRHVWLGTTVENQEVADRNIPHLLQHDAAVRFVSIEPMLGPIDLSKVCLVPQVSGSYRAGVHINALAGRFFESGMPYVDRWNDDGTHAPGARVTKLDWVIAGGESGPHARPSHPDWFRSLRDQCAAAGVPFLFKQWGEWADTGPIISAGGSLFHQFDDGSWVLRYGKKANGRLLDGVEHNGFPITDLARAA